MRWLNADRAALSVDKRLKYVDWGKSLQLFYRGSLDGQTKGNATRKLQQPANSDGTCYVTLYVRGWCILGVVVLRAQCKNEQMFVVPWYPFYSLCSVPFENSSNIMFCQEFQYLSA